MIKRKIVLVLLPLMLLSAFGFSYFKTIEDDKDRYKLIKEALYRSLSQIHFNELKVDDSLSVKAFDLYIKNIDPNKRFLLQKDLDALLKYKYSIDDDFRGEEVAFFSEAFGIINQRIDQTEKYYQEILSKPFDFTIHETIELDGEKRTFCANEKELKEEWRKYLKYLALVRFNEKLKEREESEKKAISEKEKYTQKTDEELEKKVREELKKSLDNRFDLIKKLDEEDRVAEYLNSILGVYGPHTEYYPPQEKENFDIRMSGRLEGIGAQLVQSYGEIKVTKVVPGSASWKQKELKEGDIILKVGQESEDPVSVTDMPLKDAVSLIRGKKGTEVRLTVKKPDGRIKTISIIRDEVVLQESYAKSAVIELKDLKKNYGIIDLPSFYADFNKKDGRSSAEDVEKEIIKLKSKNIDGLILDLRNNGGGSLEDAIKMSGLFFEEGPVVQVRGTLANPMVLKDRDENVVYDGPLVVMVNRFSASASEILAAALQDYGRAVIIGSDATFGKGTVQRFIDLDRTVSPFSKHKPLGSVKLTIQKFYRVNGGATQKKGVVPDVFLPDAYSYLDIGEANMDYVMPWDEIAPVKRNLWDNNVSSIKDKLSESSKKRVSENKTFQLIAENAIRLKNEKDNTNQTLHLDEFLREQKRLEKEADKFDDLSQEHDDIEITVLKDDVEMGNVELDSVQMVSAEEWSKKVAKDAYVYEAVRILNDLEELLPIKKTAKR